jgi:hypothetical protein
MNENKPDSEAIGAAQDLAASLNAMAAEVKRLRTYGRTNRRFVLVDIVLSLAIFVAGGIGVHAAQTAGNANDAQLALCRSGNVSRAQQIGIWEFVINISGPARTAREKKIRATFLHHLHAVYAPRNCAMLGQGKG